MTTNENGPALERKSPDPRELFARSLQAQPEFDAVGKLFLIKYQALTDVLDEIADLFEINYNLRLSVYRGSDEPNLPADSSMITKRAKAQFQLMLLDMFDRFDLISDDAKEVFRLLRTVARLARDNYEW